MPRMRRRPPRPLRIRLVRARIRQRKRDYRHLLRVRRLRLGRHGPADHPPQDRRVAVLVLGASRQRQPAHGEARGFDRRQDVEGGEADGLQFL